MSLRETTRLSPEVLGAELVSLIVGPKAKQVFIHKKLLCDRCEYFSKAFNSDFKEANFGSMTFPDDTEEAFTTFITWLYSGTVLLPGFPTSEAADQNLSMNDFVEKHFLPSFILADKLCNHNLMNKLIDLLQDFQYQWDTCFKATTTQRVFEEISSQSKLHLYFAANFALFLATYRNENDCKSTRDSFVNQLGTKPEFLRAVFTFQQEQGEALHEAGFELWDRASPYNPGRCYFHTHGKGDGC